MRGLIHFLFLIFIISSVFFVSGCELPATTHGMDSNRSTAELGRSVLDMEYKIADLTREVAELSDKVDRMDASISAYISGVTKTPLVEEEITPPDEGSLKEDKVELSKKEEKTSDKESGETEIVSGDAPQALYDHALDEVMKKNAKAALPRFVDFVTKYPDHDLTDNAYYWIGECYYSMKRYTDSAENFEKVVVDFPERDKVPDAMLKLGYSYAELGKKEKAEEVLRDLISIYPKSPAADLARQRLIDL